jgi:hypothetical protein
MAQPSQKKWKPTANSFLDLLDHLLVEAEDDQVVAGGDQHVLVGDQHVTRLLLLGQAEKAQILALVEIADDRRDEGSWNRRHFTDTPTNHLGGLLIAMGDDLERLGSTPAQAVNLRDVTATNVGQQGTDRYLRR